MTSKLFQTLFLLLTCCLTVPTQASDHYQIDPLHTFSSFEYLHWGLSLQRGRFDKSTGSIDLDLDGKAGNISIEIDADSVSTGSELFNKVMRSDTFFDAGQFQKILFNSTKMIFEEDRLARIEGNLTIKDITRPVVIEVTHFNCRFMFLYLKSACGANGYTNILRSDFDMGRYTPFVSDEVTLYFSVEAIKD